MPEYGAPERVDELQRRTGDEDTAARSAAWNGPRAGPLASAILVVGVQYSPKFFKDFFDVIRSRSQVGKTTLALVVRPEGPAARYLSENTTSTAHVTECVHEIERLLEEADEGRGYVRVKMHDRVMRYSFIQTERHIWIKFFTNASYRAVVPAVKVDSDSEQFAFFETDIRKLKEVSHG